MKSEHITRAAIYARVSMDEKFNDSRYQDLDNQVLPLKDWAENIGFEVTQIYKEKTSGADPNRPIFKKMMLHAHQRLFDVLLVWKLDRFSRQPMSTVLSQINSLKIRGAAVMSMTETWLDTRKENPMTELVLAIMSWAASEERRKISERTKAGINKRRAINQWKGGRPKGSKDKKKRKRQYWKKPN